MKSQNANNCSQIVKYSRLIAGISAVVLITASILLGASQIGLAADKFPTKVLQIIVPFTPGGGHDNLARPMAKLVSDKLGKPIIINNYPGAGGRIGWNRLYQSKPDGYTLATFNNSAPNGQALYSQETKYDIYKITYLINVNAEPTVIAVNSDSQFTDIVKLVEYAKSHPGEVKMGTAGVGSRTHFSGLKIMENIGAKLQFIPYGGAAMYKAALLAKEVDFVVADIANFIGNPGIKIIVVNNSKRSQYLPDVPTWKDKGFKDIEDVVWRGFVLPPGVPQDRIKILENAFRWAIEQPMWKDYCEKQRYENDYWGPEKFKQVSIREYEDAEKFKQYFK